MIFYQPLNIIEVIDLSLISNYEEATAAARSWHLSLKREYLRTEIETGTFLPPHVLNFDNLGIKSSSQNFSRRRTLEMSDVENVQTVKRLLVDPTFRQQTISLG